MVLKDGRHNHLRSVVLAGPRLAPLRMRGTRPMTLSGGCAWVSARPSSCRRWSPQPFALGCAGWATAFMTCSCCPWLSCGLPPWLTAFFAVGTAYALTKLPACEVCGMGAHFVHTWLAIPMLARADLSTPACSGTTRLSVAAFRLTSSG